MLQIRCVDHARRKENDNGLIVSPYKNIVNMELPIKLLHVGRESRYEQLNFQATAVPAMGKGMEIGCWCVSGGNRFEGAAFLYPLLLEIDMRSQSKNNGFTEITTVRIPLADVAQLKATCAKHKIAKSQVLIAGMRAELERLQREEQSTQPGDALQN